MWASRRLPRVYDILSRYSTPLGSHIWEISRNQRPGIRRRWQHHRETIDSPQAHFHAIARFQKNANLVFNIRKTKVLAKGPSADHLFECAKHFINTDPDLADIAHHFTRDMFTTEGIEVL
jgi:hypothetical protein